jgi:hypothetical protein
MAENYLTPFDCILWVYIKNTVPLLKRQSELYKKFGRSTVQRSIARLHDLKLISRSGSGYETFYNHIEFEAVQNEPPPVQNEPLTGSKWATYRFKMNHLLVQNGLPDPNLSDTLYNENTVLNPVDNSRKKEKESIKERERESAPISLPRADDSDSLDAPKLISLWHEETSGILPEMNMLKISRQTYDNIGVQLLITPDLQTWKDVFGKLKKSDWARKRKIPFLMTLKPDFRDKVLSGLYDNADSTIHTRQRITGDKIDDGY